MKLFVQVLAFALIRVAVLAAAVVMFALAGNFAYISKELTKAALAGVGGAEQQLRQECAAITKCQIRDVSIRMHEPTEGRSLARWTSFVTYIKSAVAPESKKAYLAAAKSAYPVVSNVRGEIGEYQ